MSKSGLCTKEHGRILLFVGALFLALACAPTGDGKAEPEQARAKPQEAAPKRGGQIVVGQPREPRILDPYKETSNSGMALVTAGNGLVKTDYATMAVAPDLAESWDQPDARTVVFHLRRGVKWHNKPPVNGREFNASDAKASLDRLRLDRPGFLRASEFAVIDKAEVVDDYTLKVILKEPFAPFMTNLAYFLNVIMAKEVVEKYGEQTLDDEAMIGTGPFIFQHWRQGVELLLTRNPDYWEKDKPYLDSVMYIGIVEEAARVAALLGGQLDSVTTFPFGQVAKVKQERQDIQFFSAPGTTWSAVMFNTTRKPLDDVRVRRAIQLAIDRQELIAGARAGLSQPTGPVPASLTKWAMPPNDLNGLPGYRQPKGEDLKEARRLLGEAGFSSGLTLKASTSQQFAQSYIDLAEIIVPQLAKVGIDLQLDILEWSRLKESEARSDFNLVIGSWQGTGEPNDHLSRYTYSKGAANVGKFSNASLDQLLDRQRGETDENKRRQVLLDAQKLLLDQVPYAWLETKLLINGARSYVRGWVQSPFSDEFTGQRDVWLDK